MSAQPMIEALHSGRPARVAAAMRNDLQDAALVLAPALGRTLEVGCDLGALAGIVSGSGPTCAFLCPDADAAARLAAGLAAEDVCRATTVARGPAPGATIVS
jgi:4-diphosphocytidyl-2-C-methyl-D-erythritol kinase